MLPAIALQEDAQKLKRNELDRLAAAWVTFDPDCTLFISTAKLRPFLAALPPPMGYLSAVPPSEEEVTAFVGTCNAVL